MGRKDFQESWTEITGVLNQSKNEKRNFLNQNLKRNSEFFFRDIDLSNGEPITALHSEYQSFKDENNQDFEL